MQQKRVFNKYSYFSHPRLQAQTASGFLQTERGEGAVVPQAGLGTAPGRPYPTSGSPRRSATHPPQQTSQSHSVPKGRSRGPPKTPPKANPCLERLFRLLSQLLKSLSTFSQGPSLKVLWIAPTVQGIVRSSRDHRGAHFCPKVSSPGSVPTCPLFCRAPCTRGDAADPGQSIISPISTAFLFDVTSGSHLGHLLWTFSQGQFSHRNAV